VALGAKPFTDYHELLSDRSLKLNVVINALPSHCHPSGTLEAFATGVHVVCEKPLARTVADFDKMVAAAKNAGKELFPFQNSRFTPAFTKLREIIASGCLGRIIHARIDYSGFGRRWDWQCRRDFWGGNLLNTGPHPMDQAIVLFGENTPRVFARLVCDNPFGDADNYASVTLWDHNKPTIEVVVSSFAAYPLGERYNIGATFGGLSGGAKELRWRYFKPEAAPEHSKSTGWSEGRSYCGEKLEWIEESWQLEKDSKSIDQLFYDKVYDILCNGAAPEITLDQVRRQIAVMEEAHRQNPDLA
jgi:predicted dehydrogenase